MRLITFLLFCLILPKAVADPKTPDNPSYIATANAPAPFGAYSQGISVDLSKGKLIFVAGQVGKDPKTNVTYENDIELATRQALNNIDAILRAAGIDLSHVVRMDVFLRDAKDWRGMNKEYAKHFPNGRFPVRTATQSGIVDRIEISCIAYVAS